MDKKHLYNIAHNFLELRNDDTISAEEKDKIINSIHDLLMALVVNLHAGTKDEYKNEILKIIKHEKV